MTKNTEATDPVKFDANAQYLVLVKDFITAYKNILGADHPYADELSYKMLGAFGLANRQVKRLAKIIKDK